MTDKRVCDKIVNNNIDRLRFAIQIRIAVHKDASLRIIQDYIISITVTLPNHRISTLHETLIPRLRGVVNHQLYVICFRPLCV